MNKQIELLEQIYKDATMGRTSTQTLLKDLEDKDNKIIDDVEEIFEEYEDFEEKAKEELIAHDVTPEDEGVITKMMSTMGINKEVKKDNSDSAIADMLIQGLSMGVVEMEKRINTDTDDIDKEILKFAKDFLKFQQKYQKDLKKYL